MKQLIEPKSRDAKRRKLPGTFAAPVEQVEPCEAKPARATQRTAQSKRSEGSLAKVSAKIAAKGKAKAKPKPKPKPEASLCMGRGRCCFF